jgi:hypothetical protein
MLANTRYIYAFVQYIRRSIKQNNKTKTSLLCQLTGIFVNSAELINDWFIWDKDLTLKLLQKIKTKSVVVVKDVQKESCSRG